MSPDWRRLIDRVILPLLEGFLREQPAEMMGRCGDAPGAAHPTGSLNRLNE
jgi:hypothetical protein